MNYVIAFLIGGLVCVVGQILMDKTALTPARIMVGYVVSGVVLGALGVFDKMMEFAGAGVTVPLLGFGNLLAKGAREAILSKGFLGIFTGPLTAAAGGITAAILFGYFNALLFRAREK